MIDSVFMTLSEKLNTYFTNKYTVGEDFVIISNLVNQDGSAALTESDKLILTLANVQQETLNSRRPGTATLLDTPVNLNVYVLFSAYFIEDNYEDSLKYISGIVSYFQANKVFNHQNTPGLDPSIDKITFEIENLDIQSLSQLWGVVGGKYLPSILYKLRMVPVSDDLFMGDIPRISGFNGIVR